MFEKVNPQHPDKVADRIAGAIVDLCYTKSEWPKVAAFTLIKEVIEAHEAEDPKAVMIAIKTICDYELLDNPYRSHVHLMKTKAKEL